MSNKNYSDLIAKLLKDSDGLDRRTKSFCSVTIKNNELGSKNYLNDRV